MKMANRTKAMKAPISGQNMAGNIYERPRGRAAAGPGVQTWSATCSLGEGNAQAT